MEFIDENGEKLLDFFEVEVVKKVRKKRARKSKNKNLTCKLDYWSSVKSFKKQNSIRK